MVGGQEINGQGWPSQSQPVSGQRRRRSRVNTAFLKLDNQGLRNYLRTFHPGGVYEAGAEPLVKHRLY